MAKYPYIFVAGMAGWGHESKISTVLPYWGFAKFDLVKTLRARGIDACTAAVSPLGSAWDRACELYAQLVGGRVDYGEAHSRRYGHERYGVTYPEPLVKDFGKRDAEGHVQKVNFIAHSFGGATVRQLSYLLEHGSAEERETTTDGSLSPLFAGGNGGSIFSIATVSAPHNGTDLQQAMKKVISKIVMTAYYGSHYLVANSPLDSWYDVQLFQFGVGTHREDKKALLTNIKGMKNFVDGEDNVFHDVAVDGSMQINHRICAQEDVYYFSYPVCGTLENKKGNERHSRHMLPVLYLFADRMGKETYTTADGYAVTEAWHPNDGVVNTVSTRAPETEPSKDFDEQNIEKGVWNIMPLTFSDHGSVIGWGQEMRDTMPLFCKHIRQIEKLSAND